MSKHLTIQTPIGKLTIAASDGFVTHIFFEGEPGVTPTEPQQVANTPDDLVLQMCATQLDEYFAGKRRVFDVPINPSGGPFSKRVWQIMVRDPAFGTTTTYSALAKMAGNGRASRAVGMANNRNPIPIIIPCHRVVGKNGKLTGFRAGLDVKEKLLRHENIIL